MKRKWYDRLNRTQKAGLITLLLCLLVVNVAFAYSLFRVLPFAGSIFDTGEIVLQSAFSNDDGTEDQFDGMDPGDNGLDPLTAADLVPPFGPPPTRSTSNVQSCTAIVAGQTVNVTMNSTYDALRCAVQVRIRNASSRPMVYDGATLTGAPVDIVQDPYVGQCTPPGQEPSIAFELQPQVGAVPGTTWTGATANIELEWHDVASCP